MRRNNPAVGCILVIGLFMFISISMVRLPFMIFSFFPMIFILLIIFIVIISASSHKQHQNRINELNSHVQTINPYRTVNLNQNQVKIQNKKIETNSYQSVNFCHYCGTELEKDAIFCHGCGIKIER